MYQAGIIYLLSMVVLSGCASLGSFGDSSELDVDTETPLSFSEIMSNGDDSARAGDFDAAQISYALAVEREPDNIDALYRLAFVHKHKESLDVAESLLNHLLSIREDHIPGRLLLAEIVLQIEDYERAEKVYQSILVRRPNSAEALNGMGVVHDLSSDHTIAQEYFSHALSIEPRSAKYTNNMGFSLYLQGDLSRAEFYFHEALKHDPDYARSWSNLALLYARTGRHIEADAAFRKVVADHQAANNVGYLGFMSGEHQVAHEYLNRAIAIAPSYYDLANRNIQYIAR